MISLQTPTGPKNYLLRGIKTPDGLKNIETGSILADGGDIVFWEASAYAALTVTISPPVVTGGASSVGMVTIDTAFATATVVGATPPVSWLWEVVSPDGPGWSILTPTNYETQFRCADVIPGTRSASFKVTATDSRGATGEAEVWAEVTNYGGI